VVWLERGDPARTRSEVGVPTTVPNHQGTMEVVMLVIIGIEPHKATHTAVAIGDSEDELSRLKVRATRDQVAKLLTWAAPFPSRLWAVEGAEGLGFLLAQQLVTAGETVVDVPATLAARTRVLGSGRSNKNDPNDAMSVEVTALRSRGLRRVQSVGNSEVLRLLAKRNADIGRQRSRVVSRSDRAPSVSPREPHLELCDPHGCRHPAPPQAQCRARLLRPQGRRRQDQTRGSALVEAARQQCRQPESAGLLHQVRVGVGTGYSGRG